MREQDRQFINAMNEAGLKDAERLVETKDHVLASRIRTRLRNIVFDLDDQDKYHLAEIIFNYTRDIMEPENERRYKGNQKHWMYAAE